VVEQGTFNPLVVGSNPTRLTRTERPLVIELPELIVLALFYLVPIAIIAGIFLLVRGRRGGSKRD
jgi:hypothetical protein